MAQARLVDRYIHTYPYLDNGCQTVCSVIAAGLLGLMSAFGLVVCCG